MTPPVENTFHRSTAPRSPAALSTAHRCAVEDCPALCSPGHVACRRHWCAIPQPLRNPLILAFRGRVIDPVGYALAAGEGERLARRFACHD